MKSKLLFEDLILYLNATEPSGRFIEHVETIKKDLEILEILKKYYIDSWFQGMTEKQLDKIIEWLENERK